MTRPPPADSLPTSRRGFLRRCAGLLAAVPLLRALPIRAASAAPAASTEAAAADLLWYAKPAAEDRLLFEGLPVGNGHLGALAGGDPGRELLSLAEASLWTGGRNDALHADGQFPYGNDDFGHFTQLAKLVLELPGQAWPNVADYRRELDLATGCVRVTYRCHGVRYRRELYVSHPDQVLVLRLAQDGGGDHSGRLTLLGTHGEVARDGTKPARVHLAGRFANGLRHAVAVATTAEGGRLAARDGVLQFEHCTALTVVLAAATNYTPHLAQGFIDAAIDPLALAQARIDAALARTPQQMHERHVADHRALFDTMQVNLGMSMPAQRKLDTWARLQARARSGVPDPELEAQYLQYGRYLTIAGSRDGLPTNLQGLWLAGNDPPWQGDYHTDINLQMNYWLPDRAGLGACFGALTEYCLAQLPAWTENTRRWFNDPRNPYRNSTGRLAGWTVAISTNIWGGNGWEWHPAGSAWLCNSLWQHYQYTVDRDYLARVFPLLQGACAFWQARLVETTVVGPDGQPQRMLVDDHDWSPEQGPDDARGISYAQELVWELFGNYIEACDVLRREAVHAKTIAALRARLYLPRVSPTSGQLEEWMSPDDRGEPGHRHLSPLMGLFPGDRITPDRSPPALVDGAQRLLAARGMHNYGWANAWRALCWARLKDGDKAYRLLLDNLAPSGGDANGSGTNLFDVYRLPQQGVFQIDANYGMPAAMLELLLYSRPGRIELLPALPRAWPRGRVSGIGARGGFVVDLAWADGRPVEVTLRSVGGTATTVVHGERSLPVTLARGGQLRLAMRQGEWRRT